MPKVNGKIKCFSFNNKTLEQISFLCECLMLNQTSLIEFLINDRYRLEVQNGQKDWKKNEVD